MKAVLQTWFFGLPLLWSRVYTLGLPSKVRDDRLTKIASDVYEQRAASDAEGRSNASALEVLFCVVLSVRADLLWRFE